MAESPLIDTKNDLTIAQHVAKLSDRAIQRITGGNAFLRGRLYARRNAVVDLTANGTTASAKILVRADQPYETQLGLTSEGQIISHCSCPAWRGPTRPPAPRTPPRLCGCARTSTECSSSFALPSVAC